MESHWPLQLGDSMKPQLDKTRHGEASRIKRTRLYERCAGNQRREGSVSARPKSQGSRDVQSADTGDREARTFEEVIQLHIDSSESMLGVFQRTGDKEGAAMQGGVTAGLMRAIEVYGNWSARRGADTGTTGAEGPPHNAQDYVERFFMPAVEFIQKNGYADWDGSANGQTITLTGCANMIADWKRATQRAPVTPPQGGPFSESLNKSSRDCVWIVEQNGRVHSVHSTHESAMKEQGENLRIGTPWQVLPWAAPAPVTTPGRDELIQALRSLPVHKIGSGNSSWDDVEPTEYVKLSDLNAALAAAKEPRA